MREKKKFKVGDRVRCIAEEKIPEDDMNYMIVDKIRKGRIYRVVASRRYLGELKPYIVTFEEDGYAHLASNFELVEDKNNA